MGDGSTPSPANPLKDGQNILGFLLAGFAGVLGFIGLKSSEVSEVLRNDTRQATVVAFILLLAVLAAVIGVAIPDTRKTSWVCIVGVFFLLIGFGAFVIYKIPVSSSVAEYKNSGLYAGVLAGVGAVALLVAAVLQRHEKQRIIPDQFVFIMASVILLATSMYGAMRLETGSQQNPAVQISANATKSGSDTALSVHVTASKLSNSNYIGVAVIGLKTGIHFQALCQKNMKPDQVALCTENPCRWLDDCVVIFGGVFPPDATGSVDETLADTLIPGQYQDITVRGSVCAEAGSCPIPEKTVSRVDIHLSNLPPVSASATSGS
jgi:hypothetical protein